MTSVLITGIAVHDVVFGLDAMPRDAGKHYAKTRKEVVGGIAANASIAVARLGGHAYLSACLGDDVTGRAIAEDLEGNGVDLSAIEWAKDAASGLSAILVDADGERLLINHVTPQLFERDSAVIANWTAPLDAVMTDTRWYRGAMATLGLAKRLGVPSVVDFDRVPEQGALDWLERASHVIFSEAGLLALSQCGDAGEALHWARARSSAFLAVTAGERGVFWLDDDKVQSMPAFAVKAVDTLGAGDVFHGAFTFALGEAMPIGRALRFASAAAALKCMTFGGGSGTPSRNEVERFLGEQQT